MKLLLDANLSPALVEQLGRAGHTAVHVADLDMLAATDDAILDRASSDGFVLITADSDFPMLLALRRRRPRRSFSCDTSTSFPRADTVRWWPRTFRS